MTNRCCNEFAELSRRGFLAATGLAALSTMTKPLARVALARDFRSSQRDVLLTVFLRGGADGLSMCVPHADPWYYQLRPTIAVPRPSSSGSDRAIDLDGFFGLAPALQPLHNSYLDDQLLLVQSCGSPNSNRSHFAGQYNVETGVPSIGTTSTGWVGRHVASMPPLVQNSRIRAAGISYGGLQQSLAGAPSTLALPPDLSYFGLYGMFRDQANIYSLRSMYEVADEPLRGSGLDALDAVGQVTNINFTGYTPRPGVTYPSTTFGTTLKHIAALIKAQIGVEAIALDSSGGWDTHALQGPTTGEMAQLMSGLSSALAAFHADTRDLASPGVTTVVLTEFGRSVYENSSQGTDHGRAGTMMVLGRNVAGGRVLADWPGLAPEFLEDGRDLRVTIDYRDILAEVVSSRLGNSNLSEVFPGYTPMFRGVTT